MSPQGPRLRKPRSPGRRQFGGVRGGMGPGGPGGPGMHGGTDDEWEQVMQSPQVQRALNDPGIAQALYHNLQGTVPGGMASVVPPPQQPPMRMQGGGMANALDMNEIVAMLNDPNTPESRKQSLRMSLARAAQAHVPQPQMEEEEAPVVRRYQDGGAAGLTPEEQAERAAGSRSPAQAAQMQQLGFNPDTGSPGQRPLRFQTGGSVQATIQRMMDLQKEIADPNTPAAKKASDQAEMVNLTQQLQGAQAQPSSLSLPGGGGVSSTQMSGLSKLAGQGPPTLGNTAAAVGAGALLGLGSTSQHGLGALVGAGTAGILNYLIRKYGKGAQRPAGTTGAAGGAGGISNTPEQNLSKPAGTGPQSTAPAATTTQPNQQANAAPATPAAPKAPQEVTTSSGATVVQAAQPWNKDWRTNPDTSSGASQPTAPSDQLPTAPVSGPNADIATSPGGSGGYGGPGQGLWMGSANSPSGNVVSTNGQNWVDQQTKQPWTGAVGDPTQISPASSLLNATPATTAPSGLGAALPPLASDLGLSPAYMADPSLLDLGDTTMAKGGRVRAPKAVLLRKPMGMPIPVLHTTIVIAAKPKGGKKKPAKPDTKQAGGVIRPLKPQLLPPRYGPQDHGPRPHGRVQVPRGSGAAIKGKRFGGIY